MKKQKMHFVPDYLLSPVHPITVNLIGCGGTGSNILANLVALHLSLKALGHPGLFVYAFDNDIVTEANAARQLFYPGDVGMNKATCLISRINRSYGLNWTSIPEKYEYEMMELTKQNNKKVSLTSNITISCVDSVKARKSIGKALKQAAKSKQQDHRKPFYWIDTGNGKDFGQVILGTVDVVKRKSDKYHAVQTLPNVLQEFPNMKDDKNDDQPSCSLAEALSKQDLYINKSIAMYTTNMMWKMFRKAMLPFRGIYVNLEMLSTNTILL